MERTTFEEASHCPRCDTPGEKVSETLVSGMRRGTRVVVLFCRNKDCRWFNTSWLVQIDPDGTVPIPDKRTEDRNYPSLVPDADAQRLVDNVARQLSQETNPGGGEVYRGNR